MNKFKNGLDKNFFTNYKLYFIQQDEINEDINCLKKRLNFIKNSLVEDSKRFNLYSLLKSFFPLKDKILLSRKLIIQKINFSPSLHTVQKSFGIEGINS